MKMEDSDLGGLQYMNFPFAVKSVLDKGESINFKRNEHSSCKFQAYWIAVISLALGPRS